MFLVIVRSKIWRFTRNRSWTATISAIYANDHQFYDSASFSGLTALKAKIFLRGKTLRKVNVHFKGQRSDTCQPHFRKREL